ncbi:MAG: hypothetical protein WCJ81_06050 [bacterium]
MLGEIGCFDKIIFMGDFNTGRHFIDERGKTFYCSDCMFDIEQAGMIDVWRYKYKDVREYSRYSNKGN